MHEITRRKLNHAWRTAVEQAETAERQLAEAQRNLAAAQASLADATAYRDDLAMLLTTEGEN